MKKIAFLSQKGGSGKTTLAVHVAVAAEEAGERVVLADTDPQQSALTWAENRQNESPIVIASSAGQLEAIFKAATTDKMTLAIVDTAPHAAPDATRIAQGVDLVIIPCRPTAFDLAAVGAAVNIVKAANVQAAFVLSACPFRSPEIAETRQILSGYGIPISPVEIVDRRAFARAVASGRAVTEFEKDGKAAIEIKKLWQWLKEFK